MIDEENQVERMQGSTVDSAEAAESSPAPDAQVDTASAVQEELAGLGSEDKTGSAQDEAAYQEKLAEMGSENQALKAQLEDRTNQLMRNAADFENYRKRTERQKEEFEQQVKCSTLNELLPVVDNFERARSQIKPQTDEEAVIHKSYQSVYKQLVDSLKRLGVSPMRSEGKDFDPNLHEAVMRQPTDEYSEGTVMEELQRGYMLGDRVLRHALVKVAAPPEPVIGSDETDQGHSEG